jgi:hypothetical protein
VVSIKQQTLGSYQPSCASAHDMINQLSNIVGNCELLRDELPKDAACSKRLRLIQDVAKSGAEELKSHQRILDRLSLRCETADARQSHRDTENDSANVFHASGRKRRDNKPRRIFRNSVSGNGYQIHWL